MSSTNNSSNRMVVPEAKEASYQNGSVGGYMVKKMIEEQEKKMAGK